ncbi:aldolase [Neobacillus sp. PS3-12]|jgi:uncharacterized protein YlzI (FlbEa/FlbD family)|uniref:aldolase n=1 Tax=Neobacillus sp. PS3-12 TaxID=3070677 RepID=UPI0027E0386B|nr:aldolase [Neobacillus sp. PS3-12]WML51576.1 aldolase [Neobacillus sp. PS3-12]
MIRTKKSFAYIGFGMDIVSEIRLPELTRVGFLSESPDVRIEINDLTKDWYKFDSETRKKFVVEKGKVMFEVPNTAIFLITEGQKIVVSPMIEAEEDKIRLYILGTCMGAILIQKRILPLHGSALAINGKAYAFIGDSGAGKSTLAAALIKKGYALMSDDVIPVSLSKENVPFVTSTYPQQKLWQQSLNHFGIDTDQFRSLFERETKFVVPVNANFSSEPLQLAGVFELVISNDEDVIIEKIEGLERFRTLYNHTFRNFLISRLGLEDWHFLESSRILNQINVYKLQRTQQGFTVNHLVDLILDNLKREEGK